MGWRDSMHSWGDTMHGWGGHGFGGVFMVVFWILVVVGIIFLVRGFGSRSGASGRGESTESALDILKRRYAKGEMNKSEFEEKKKDILNS